MVGWCPGDNQTEDDEKQIKHTQNIQKQTKPLCFCDYYLYACMAAQVKVKLKGMSDAGVHCGSCRNISTLPNL